MSQKAYEDACLRAELFGLPKPDREEFLAKNKHLDVVEFEEVDIRTAENTAMLDGDIKAASGGIAELNTILTSTQTKINSLRGVCGSLTNFFRVKLAAKDNLSYSSEPSYVGQTNYDKDYVPPQNQTDVGTINSGLSQNDNEMTISAGKKKQHVGGGINDALADLESMQEIKDSGALSKSAALDVKKQVSSQVSKLDNLIHQTDRAQSSLAHQNKQLRTFLRRRASTMPLTADVAAQQVQDRLRSLHRLVYDIEAERGRNEQCIDSILRAEKAADSPTTADDSSGSSQQQMQLKNLYKSGLAAAEQEERVLRAALSRIYEIRAIRNERRIQARHAGNKETIGCGALIKMLLSSAATLPLHVGRAGQRAPPLCGAIPAEPGHVARAGDAVAARVRVSDNEDNWILAEVVGWLPAQGKYEVDDIDEEQKNRHVLSKRRVVPLPLMRAEPRTDEHALFPKGAVVMALYPQTTCFYRAIVNRLPASAADPYEVLFEDSSYADGYSPPERVAQRYVIAIKEGKGRAT